MAANLDDFHVAFASGLDAMSKLLPDHYELTLVVRNKHDPDSSFVLSADRMESVIDALNHLHKTGTEKLHPQRRPGK